MDEQHQAFPCGDTGLLQALRSFRESLAESGDKYSAVSSDELDAMLARLDSSLSRAEVLDFSGADDETLSTLGISLNAIPRLKPNYEQLVQVSKDAGDDSFWSSPHLYQHLRLLEKNIATARAPRSRRFWIDAFIFRATEMIGNGKCTLIKSNEILGTPTLETSLVTVDTSMDYATVRAGEDATAQHHAGPSVPTTQGPNSSFLVMEAISFSLSDDRHRAICEAYVRCKQLQQDTIRFAVTDGLDWTFLVLHLNQDGKGASYKRCYPVRCSLEGRNKLVEPCPDVVAGILSHWIQRSGKDLDDDDWFNVDTCG